MAGFNAVHCASARRGGNSHGTTWANGPQFPGRAGSRTVPGWASGIQLPALVSPSNPPLHKAKEASAPAGECRKPTLRQTCQPQHIELKLGLILGPCAGSLPAHPLSSMELGLFPSINGPAACKGLDDGNVCQGIRVGGQRIRAEDHQVGHCPGYRPKASSITLSIVDLLVSSCRRLRGGSAGSDHVVVDGQRCTHTRA